MNRTVASVLIVLLCLGIFTPLIGMWQINPAYGTTIFSDTFESGTFLTTDSPPGAWTTQSAPNPTITTTAHHGAYAGQFVQSGGYRFVTKNLSSTMAVVYHRFYFRTNLLPDANGEKYDLSRGYGVTAGTGIFQTTIANYTTTMGGLCWSINYRSGSTWTEVNSTVATISIDTWYCVEIYWKIGASDGEVHLYINGVEKISVTGKDTNNYGNCNQIRNGVTSLTGVYPTIIVDCVVVSDTYVGVEDEAGGVTFSDIGKNTTLAGAACNLYVNCTAVSGTLSHYIFEQNNTGTPTNETTAFSGGTWANKTITLNTTVGVVVHWKVYANNSLGIWGNTGIQTITTTSGATGSLTVGVDYWGGGSVATFNSATHKQRILDCGLELLRLEVSPNYHDEEETLIPAISGAGLGIIGVLMEPTLDPDNYAAYGTWVQDIVTEFKDYVHIWEIWNEPNLDNYFSGADPVKYVNFLMEGYTHAKIADPTCTVLGGCAVFTRTSTQAWVHTIYDNGAKNYMDALSFHPYVDQGRSPAATGGNNPYTDLPLIWDIMNAHGDYRHMWITEIGWQTGGTDYPVSEQTQADYLVLAMQMAIDWGWVDTFIIYKWIDGSPFFQGLETSTGTRKLSYYAVQAFIAGLGETPPEYSDVTFSTTLADASCQFMVKLFDNDGTVSKATLSTNNTGTQVNQTWTTVDASVAWVNYNITLNATIGNLIRFQWYFNDSDALLGSTGFWSLTTTGAGTNTLELVAPEDAVNQTSNLATFAYKVVFASAIQNASLWLNLSGTWQSAAPNATAVENSTNEFSFNFGAYASATYTWNVRVCSSSTAYFGPANRTIRVAIDPVCESISHNDTTKSVVCLFETVYSDEDGLHGYYGRSNNSGSWVNQSWTLFVAQNGNFTLTLNATVGTVVQYQFVGNDTNGHVTSSSIGELTITSVLVTITAPTNTTHSTLIVPVEIYATGGTIHTMWWNCTLANGTVIYGNTVYMAATTMTLVNGSYIFNAVANNTLGDVGETQVMFTVASAESIGEPWFAVTVGLVTLGGVGGAVWFYRRYTKKKAKVIG